VIPFLVQLLFFLTPVIYPVSITTNQALATLLELNPMTAPVELFRSGITGVEPHTPWGLSVITASALLFLGLVYFRRTEAYFADLA
jgi:lipopolysaccharide transport system permease protein